MRLCVCLYSTNLSVNGQWDIRPLFKGQRLQSIRYAIYDYNKRLSFKSSKRYMTMHKGIKIRAYLKGQARQPDSICELLFWVCFEITPFGSTLLCYLYKRPIIGQTNWSHQLQPRFKIAVLMSLIVDFARIDVNLYFYWKKKKHYIGKC